MIRRSVILAASMLQIVFGIVQWTLIIVSVAGTLALFTWIAVMFLKKDR